jgi:hypothetical protein
MLVARLVESTTEASILRGAYKFLREARATTLEWLRKLSVKLQKAETESQVIEFQQRVCEMAAICRSTFDVNAVHLPKILSTPEDYSILISCSVTIFDNQPPNLGKSPPSLQSVLCRDHRLTHKLAPFIMDKLRGNSQLLDQPVSRTWGDYRHSSSGWRALSDPNSRWISTTTASTKNHIKQHVHFNLLEGQLLVNGKPLGRLPQEYVIHPTYTRLFGQVIFSAVPA